MSMRKSIPAFVGASAIVAGLCLTMPPALASPQGASGLNLAAIDKSIKPGDDFFDYAIGTWYSHADMPADHSEIGIEQETSDKVQDQLRTLVEQDALHPDNANARLIGALYKSYTDERRIEALDDKPLRADLARIAAVRDRAGFATLMGESWFDFGSDAFTLLVQPDAHRPVNSLTIGQGGLGLPGRDYYRTADFSKQRDAYQAYAARTLRMIGVPNPDQGARSIALFETRIARVSWTEAEQREVDKTYNPMTLAQLKAYAPGFDWRSYLSGAGVSNPARLVIAEKTAVRDIARIVAETPLPTLKLWETFRTVDNASALLSNRFAQNRFEFRNHELLGATAMRPRQLRAISQVNQSLGDAVGHEYSARYFPPASKARIEAMVAGLKAAMAARIRAASWMSESTRAEALDKLARMKVFVGYPDRWQNYSRLKMRPDDLYGNVRRSVAFDWAFQAAKVGKPVNSDEWGPFYWGIHPQTVDAFNIASENKIIFPAALLQPPEFDAGADPAVNYGGIGAVIGHEISHGFDDQGRKIDASGTLRNWWTAEDAARYRTDAEKLVDQVNSYEILPGVHLNGQQTLGENIADLAGLLVALDAYHASLGGKPAPVIDGLTGDQRVFVAWGQKWRRKNRDDALRMQATMDTHSPARFRAIGAVRNIDAWYRAFNVQPGDHYYLPPEKRARIW
jgi:putative endopeptidase